MKIQPGEKVLFSRWRLLFPSLIVPYFKGSHTAALLGIHNWKPSWFKDVKFALKAKIYITNLRIIIQGLLIRSVILEIKRSDIESVAICKENSRVLEIEFSEFKSGILYRILTSGHKDDVQPKNKIYLNLGADTEKCFQILQSQHSS